MVKNEKSNIWEGLDLESKKELLHDLVVSLLAGLREEEKKDILQAALTAPRKNRELIDMVGH